MLKKTIQLEKMILVSVFLLVLLLCLMYGLVAIVDIKLAVMMIMGGLVLAWFWFDIRIGLWVTLFSMLLGQIVRLDLGTGGLLVSDLMMGALVVVWIIYFGFQKIKITWNIVWLAMVMFLIVSLMTNIRASFDFHSGNLVTMWLYWARMILYSCFLPITWSVVSWYDNGWMYLKWLLTAGIVLLLLGFLQLIFFPNIIFLAQYGWDPHIGRLLSTFLDPNFVGAVFVFFLAICFAFYFQYKQWGLAKFGWMGLTLLFALGIVLTYSRSAYVALVVVFLILSFWKDKRILLFGIIAGTMMFFGDPRVMERVDGIFQVDETAQKRIISWENSLQIVEDNVWYGIGYNNMLDENMRRGFVKDARLHSAAGSDSSYLTVWSTMGLLGLIWYVFFWVITVSVLLWKHVVEKKDNLKKWLYLGVGVGIIGVLVHAQFTNSLLYNHIYMIILFAIGLCMGWKGRVSNK